MSGSSPLARGLPWPRSSAWAQQDHPRSRGVYELPPHTHEIGEGSSPLARGLRRRRRPPRRQGRIIPARAGFTADSASSDTGHSDHPRSRGVYSDMISPSFRPAGSSPLARGLPAHRDARVVRRRIIPARAGFTLYPGRY